MKRKLPQWLLDLDAVRTTYDEAKQIFVRNDAGIKALDWATPWLLKGELPPDRVMEYGEWEDRLWHAALGCPHCDNCTRCSWRVTRQDSPGSACVYFKFSKSCLEDVQCQDYASLVYDKHYIEIDIYCGSHPNKQELAQIKREIKLIRQFLLDHKRWARRKMANPDKEK